MLRACQLNAFNKELVKKQASSYAIWAQLEGFAGFAQSDAVVQWFRKQYTLPLTAISTLTFGKMAMIVTEREKPLSSSA